MKAIVLTSILCLTAGVHAQSAMECPMHQQKSADDQRAAGVDTRGDHAMGFSHETTVHHFTLLPDGGAIEVDTKTERDEATRGQIRTHLMHIAAMFSASDFEIPMFIHDTIPPGVPMMKRKQAQISYTFQPTAHGAQVRIKTTDPESLKAIHEFLAFQIVDHRTGDATQ
jgi:hypothetical protein